MIPRSVSFSSAVAIFLYAFVSPVAAQTYPGLPTRSQNPLLQSYFIPAIPITSEQRWTFSQSLYITNTYTQETRGNEDLEVDVENTRLDFQATYKHELWYLNTNLAFISNRAGFLDHSIYSFHDFFGMPQGRRDTAQNDQIRLFYQYQDSVFIDQQEPVQGLADIQFAAGYQLNPSTQLWGSLEIPAAESSPVISNDAIDTAFWISRSSLPGHKLTNYQTLGIIFPANKGLFKDQLHDQVLFAQLGLSYRLAAQYQVILQADLHSEMFKHSKLDLLAPSIQGQFGLRISSLSDKYDIDLFFSEDINPGHAPDITFGLRVSPAMNY